MTPPVLGPSTHFPHSARNYVIEHVHSIIIQNSIQVVSIAAELQMTVP